MPIDERGIRETRLALTRMTRAFRRELRSATQDSITIYQKQLKSRLRAGTGAATLGPRSSNYRRSVQREYHARGRTIHAALFVNLTGSRAVPYARALERGSTHGPKTAKVLTIPVAGSLAAPARHRPSRPIQLFANGFWTTTKKGLPAFVYFPGKVPRRGGGNRRRRRLPNGWALAAGAKPLYWGVKSVTIRARPVWQTTFDRQTPRVLRRFEIAVDRALAAVAG